MTSTARTSYTLIPNQKYRRSNRHSRQHCDIVDTDPQSLSTLGYFKTLPLEIFQMLLNYLSVKDISMLCMVSKTIGNRLITYISTPSGNRRLLLQDFHNIELPGKKEGSYILEHYKSLGLLLKRCTLLLPTKDRLKYIHKILSEVSCFKFNGCPSPLHCLGLQCYGVFLQILTAGWDELECHRVFNFLSELSNLPRKVQTVVSSKPGSARKLELRIRLFCRSVFLNHWIHRSDSAFWLTRILKPWPMVNQARLLYIIFGPVSSLDVVPREWLMENNARLLILSGNNICFTFMASKAVNGRAFELARLVVFLALVCEKDLYCMDWAVKMMQKVCKVFSTPGERNNFLQSVENAFAHIIMDMLQAVLSGDRDEEDISFLNLFHLINAQANFHKEILYLTMRSNSI
ncbi:F-box only protein 47 isoform X2 [Anas platyrhynchos]|uniref:F-box only protein 47 isoform X2 n=1 Tax=Anas platyrhynchos TaxID=8839 RepID=UPI00065DE497|eukprot:XP_012962954.1 F-box only protein 47 isoform X2 [Anas platyrhynchos]